MSSQPAAIAALVAAAVAPAAAAPCGPDAAARAAAIGAHLEREAHRARAWDWAWGTSFGVVAVGYGAMAASRWDFGHAVDDDVDAGLWVGAGKSAIAAASHLVLPLDVTSAPAPTGDPCVDQAAAERALRATARAETSALWLGLAGGVLLNGSGLLILGLHEHAWGEGALSVALGLPIAIAHAWSAPHASRRGVADGRFDGAPATWQLDAIRGPGFTGVAVRGSF